MRPITKALYALKDLTLSKIILKGHIVVPEQDLASVRDELPNHIELTRRESGCLVFEVNQDLSNERIFRVYEEFVDQASFDSHQDRVKASRWGSVTVNVERHYGISEEPVS